MALARRGDAPQVFARLDSRGVPVAAIIAGTAMGYVAVVMSYISPDTVFAFLVNSYGTVAVFVYVLIAVSQLVLRRRLEREAPEKLGLRMWGYPYLTWIAIADMACLLTAMAFIPEQRLPLLFESSVSAFSWWLMLYAGSCARARARRRSCRLSIARHGNAMTESSFA